MTDNLDRFWQGVRGKLRRALWLCPLTPDEAEREFASAPDAPLNEGEIESLVRKVTTESCEPSPEPGEWSPELDTSEIRDSVYQLNRNRGETDLEVDERLDELRRKALGEDEPEEPKD